MQTNQKQLVTQDTQTKNSLLAETECQTSKQDHETEAQCQTISASFKNEVCSTIDLIDLTVSTCQTEIQEQFEVSTNTDTFVEVMKDKGTSMPQLTFTDKSIEAKFETKTFSASVQTDAIPELLKLSDPQFGQR